MLSAYLMTAPHDRRFSTDCESSDVTLINPVLIGMTKGTLQPDAERTAVALFPDLMGLWL
jgi:hypothetical protein